MTPRPASAEVHARRVDGLRLVSSVAWLVFALAFCRTPLGRVPGFASLPLPDFFGVPPGFMVRVVSSPPGAGVLIDGEDRGASPLFTNVVCVDGQSVVIRVAKPGWKVWERTVACREHQTLLVQPRLERR